VDNSFEKAFFETMHRKSEMLGRVMVILRHLEPQLRDLNANNTADRIAALIGEFDALEAQLHAAAIEDKAGMLEFLKMIASRR
jgi:hypothetical protein